MKPIHSLIAIAALSSTLLAGNGQGKSPQQNSALQVQQCDVNQSMIDTTIYPLSYEQQSAMEFMYEEEKMARDIYLTFYDAYGLRIFQNIAKAEQKHMDTIKTLLDKYSIDTGVDVNDIGHYIDADIQALHDQLIAQGMQSLEEALKVGQAIEIVDIEDLDIAIANANPDATLIYERLRVASESHLAAFTRLIDGDIQARPQDGTSSNNTKGSKKSNRR
ncbi:MAG: DUF2202 domain-containing protein [Campylobacterota bacterium]|nr:DUF2202 domain-containing protein [Campylobacterota bacterium]